MSSDKSFLTLVSSDGQNVLPGDNEDTSNRAEAAALFDTVSARLRERVGIDVFTSWFSRIKLHSFSNHVITLSVPTAFLKSWINNRYLDLITSIVQEIDPTIAKAELIVRSASRRATGAGVASSGDEQFRAAVRPTDQPELGDRARPLFGSPLDSRYTFDTFVKGHSNRDACDAARTIAEGGVGAERFNPLFIHASVGLGKTHLLQAIANLAIHSRAQRVVYLTAEYFMWRFATAIRDRDSLPLVDATRGIDLLLVDDMQFLQGKLIQREFCHLLNMLLDSAKQVVVSADRGPWELESLESGVRSRLQSGVAVEIDAPDYEMRFEILKRRLALAQQEDRTVDLPLELLKHVARIVTGSGRELEGAFNQLLFRRSFDPDLTIERVDELLAHIVSTDQRSRVRIEDIQRVVARHYNVSRQDLLSNRRANVIIKPRQIAMYLSKMLTPRSLPEIGRRFGGRDHTTVLHAVRKIDELIVSDDRLYHEVELLKRIISET
ncbi:chromosomal replication initiator protein DnaA [Ensifer sp.]|jgi:chromosomal replication initiator protein|uniref:chromosomal replication initiator protein DnaA n=1 Tax=Ensifer sp. TaxID=1872086 RepID=UPI002E0F482B|nr:chromosomal replication initiator protein DnaA [Ensifer sp.]